MEMWGSDQFISSTWLILQALEIKLDHHFSKAGILLAARCQQAASGVPPPATVPTAPAAAPAAAPPAAPAAAASSDYFTVVVVQEQQAAHWPLPLLTLWCRSVCWMRREEGPPLSPSSEIIGNLWSDAQLLDGGFTNICTARFRSELKAEEVRLWHLICSNFSFQSFFSVYGIFARSWETWWHLCMCSFLCTDAVFAEECWQTCCRSGCCAACCWSAIVDVVKGGKV